MITINDDSFLKLQVSRDKFRNKHKTLENLQPKLIDIKQQNRKFSSYSF